MKKRISALLLAAVLCLCLVVTASAEGHYVNDPDNGPQWVEDGSGENPDPDPAPTPDPDPTPGGGGGDSSSSGNLVSIPSSSISHGQVTASPSRAEKGEKVTLTVRPDSGYELDRLTITERDGTQVEVTKVSDTKYTFIMPSGKVTVDASFVKIQEQTPAPEFTDVASGAYYADAVAWAVKNGITAGTTATTFSPDTPCTRAQIVTFLWRSAGSPKASGNTPFADVAYGSYYYDAVQWAVAQGITSGTSATTFSPDATCTRAQAVTFLYRYEKSPAVGGGSMFTDVAGNAYYINAVQWAVTQGVTAGTSATTFSPDNTCTRAQIVTFLYRDMA